MENEQNQSSDSSGVRPAQDSASEQEQYVARKAYEDVTNDMHKFKQRYKAEAAKAAELEAKMRALEDDRLKEQERYKELYEREKKERETVLAQQAQEKARFTRGLKLSALKAELGGKIRDEYLQHANIDAIEMNDDGTLSSESVREIANRFRQEHPQLIPSAAAGSITGQAPAKEAVVISDKPIEQMSFEEKAALLASLKRK